MVESDLVPLDELPYEEKPESDVLGPGPQHSVSRHAQCSCAVAVDGDRGESLESQFHQKGGTVYHPPCPVAKCLKLALHSRLCSESLRLGSEADQSSP